MKEALVIGAKPYIHLPLNNIIDRFEENYRCNFGVPNRNNGTKYDKLGLCNHVYQNLISKKLNRAAFLKNYGRNNEEDFITDYYDSFEEHKLKYKEIFHAQFRPHVFNKKLAEWGCPHRFTKIPRTGQTIIFENLLKKKKVFVAFFSLSYDKIKKSRGTLAKKQGIEGPSHCGVDETKILMWLHEKELVDATLCMLEDTEAPTLNCMDLKPSEFILNLLKEECGDVIEKI